MATVFMRWLETRPGMYDRGIRLLTMGRLKTLQDELVAHSVRKGMRVLEIGCGTGALTMEIGRRGANVIAIDRSPAMLDLARERIRAAGLDEYVEFRQMDAALIGEHFPPEAFDLIVASLSLSEMAPQARLYVAHACRELLGQNGFLAVLDETQPEHPFARVVSAVVRGPLRALTWLLTRTTTHAWVDLPRDLLRSGFEVTHQRTALGGTLSSFVATVGTRDPRGRMPPQVVGRLERHTTIRTRIIDLWALFLRIVPPYPAVRPGLYAVGQPDRSSPLLLTGNFELTVRRLVNVLDGKQSVWLLVVDSGGINVWCAAGGGFLTAEKIVGALKVHRPEEVVSHRKLILPQLCANGVDGWHIRRETEWGVHWGPVRAQDLPAYLQSGGAKTEAMRYVRFPLRDRVEMMAATLGFYGLVILIPVGLFWRGLLIPTLLILTGLSLFYAITQPWLPGRDGLEKSVPLALIALAGLTIFSRWFDPVSPQVFFSRAIGVLALSVFVAAEMQGMSPVMRGEQANWTREAVIGIILGVVYWGVPRVVGWL